MARTAPKSPQNGARGLAYSANAYKWNGGPLSTDSSAPKFAKNEEHVAAVLAAGVFTDLNTEAAKLKRSPARQNACGLLWVTPFERFADRVD